MKNSSNILNGLNVNVPAALGSDFLEIVSSKFPFDLLEEKEGLFDNSWFSQKDSFAPPANHNAVFQKTVNVVEEVSNTIQQAADNIDNFAGAISDTTTELATGLSAGVTGLYETYTSGLGALGVVSDYNITVTFNNLDSWTTGFQDTFIYVVEYLSTLITEDLTDVNGIDDMSISANISQLDGFIGWGSAGGSRTDGTSYSGSLWLDPDFMNKSYTGDLILHETLHTLGFGVNWSREGLVETVDGASRFTGENAIAAYNYGEYSAIAAGDSDSLLGVPIEVSGGSGTADVHWENSYFGNAELGTGNLTTSNNYLSTMTLASMEDLGYETIFDVNDPTASLIQLNEFIASLSGEINHLPVAINDSYVVNEDEVLSSNVITNDYDPDGDAISVVAGTIATTAGGTVIMLADGSFEYAPAVDYNGADSFTYTLQDSQGARSTGTATIDVLPINDFPDNTAPIANDDSFRINEDTALSGNVLTNDTDIDGDSLSVIEQIIQTVHNGQVALYSDGSFNYTPFKDYNGTDSFEYTVTDGKEGLDTGTVNITIDPVEDVKGGKGKPDKGDGGTGGGKGGGKGKGGKVLLLEEDEESATAAMIIQETDNALNFEDVLSDKDHLESVFNLLDGLSGSEEASTFLGVVDHNAAQEGSLSIVENTNPLDQAHIVTEVL